MRGEDAPQNRNTEMDKRSGKCKKSYVDHPRSASSLTCIKHGHGYYLEHCNILIEFEKNTAGVYLRKTTGNKKSMLG